jgi:para-aminobenzoate synthetase component 1
MDELILKPGTPTEEIDAFLHKYKGRWVMGHFTYEFGHSLETSLSGQTENSGTFEPASLFVPRFVTGVGPSGGFHLDQESGVRTTIEEFVAVLKSRPTKVAEEPNIQSIDSEQDSERKEYHIAFDTVKQHLLRGDIYELNYCLPFGLRGKISDPTDLWLHMQSLQKAPMAALYRKGNAWLLCCSPERFLKKTGNTLLTQPIKGTRPRGKSEEEDRMNRDELYRSEKERAENVMIVDLARNDLGRVARTGSVVVQELFGIHSFASVHQMISTVSAELKDGITFTDILKALFPMGSMTGAPKIRAMEIIRETESQPRGIFSGTVGYIDPQGDFDFNVVIRSIIYDDATSSILYPAGSAITAYSDPGQEFDECLLKARGMRKVLGV